MELGTVAFEHGFLTAVRLMEGCGRNAAQHGRNGMDGFASAITTCAENAFPHLLEQVEKVGTVGVLKAVELVIEEELA